MEVLEDLPANFFLFKNADGETPLSWAIDRMHEDFAMFAGILIENGAIITEQDANGRTPLLLSAIR